MNPTEVTLYDLIERKTGFRPSLHHSFDALEIDSLGMAELTCEIETAFAIRIGDDIADVTNMAELLDYIERRRSQMEVR